MIRILAKRIWSDLVSLTVNPADWPMIPRLGNPTNTPRVLEGVLFDASELMLETAGIAHDTENGALAQRCDQHDAGRIIEQFPIAAGAARGGLQQRIPLVSPKNVVPIRREDVQ